jgi:hypothetical protein
MKKIAVMSVLFLLATSIVAGISFFSSAQSGVSFDKSISWVGQTANKTLSITPSGTNELLLVGSAYNTNYGINAPTSPGLNFTQVRHVDTTSSIGINVYFAILNISQTYFVSVSYQHTSNNLGIILVTFSGENLTNPIAQSVGTKGSSSVPTIPIAPLSANDLIWAFTGSNSPTTQKAGQGFSLDQQAIYYGSPADEYGYSSTISFGTLVTGTWTLIGLEILASGVTTSTTTSMTTTSTTTITVTNQYYVTTTVTLPLPPNTVVSTVNVTSTVTQTEYK